MNDERQQSNKEGTHHFIEIFTLHLLYSLDNVYATRNNKKRKKKYVKEVFGHYDKNCKRK